MRKRSHEPQLRKEDQRLRSPGDRQQRGVDRVSVDDEARTPSAPATVANPIKEDQLNTITLTAEAVQRLALRTAQVERKPMRRTRIYGGEVCVPVGQSILVSAPVSGTLRMAAGGVPRAGQKVKGGQTVFQLAPLLTPEDRTNLASAKIEAEGQLKTAQTHAEAARVALDRAQRMLASQTGSQRLVDEAQAQFDSTEQAVAAAASRLDLLEKLAGEIEQGTTPPLSIASPLDGLLRNVAALPGENVPGGGLLFEVVNLDRVWVRVPIYVGDVAEVDAAAGPGIGDLAMRPGSRLRRAEPIHAPPTADATAGTIDLYYELENREESFCPGQRVGVALTGGRESPLTRWLKWLYRGVLPALVRHPYGALVLLLVMFGVAGAGAMRLGQEFLPKFQETDFLMHFVEKPGTSVEAMRRVTIQASKDLRAITGVRNFGSHIGRAEVADEPVGPNFTELWISIDPNVDYQATITRIEQVVYAYPGLYRDLLTDLRERIKEVLTGTSATIVVRLYGPDLDVLRSKAKEVEAAISSVPGVVNLKVEPQILVPQIEVRLRPDAAERFGLTAGHVRRASTTLLKGAKVGEVYEDQKKFDVVVWGVPSVRSDSAAIRALPIDTPSGTQVRLGDVADVVVAPTPSEIKRENASRRLNITCNVEGRDLGSVAQQIESQVRQIAFDREYRPEFLGEYAARQESTQRLYGLAGLAFVGMILLLYVDLKSWRPTLIVVFTVPFALIGGVAAVLTSGGVLSLGSLVGFVTVLGIAARNGIMMVSHFRHLEIAEGEPFGAGLVLRGAEERLAPILMTALTTGLALVPLVIAGNKPGHEIEYPLAVVILGGLFTSTVLNLFLLPPLYARFGRPVARGEEP